MTTECRSMRLICSSIMMSLAAISARAQTPAAPPKVSVCTPIARQVAQQEDFTGRLDAASSVVLKPRVSGYINQIRFRDGSEVKAGDVLFEIDPRPYQAELARADANVAVSEARVKLAKANLDRVSALVKTQAISREELEKAASDVELATAGVRVACAARDSARITLDFTKVVAPIEGRIGRRLLDVGNLVKADETTLATIINSNPIQVNFDIDERTLLRMSRALKDGKLKEFAVTIGAADDVGFTRRATIDFADNRVSPEKGTLQLRAVLLDADKKLLPGMFCRVRLVTGEPYQALLVPERAVRESGGEKSVFVVNDKNTVESRRIELGPRQDDGLRVVRSGLKGEERVVLDTRQVTPGMTVDPVDTPSGSP